MEALSFWHQQIFFLAHLRKRSRAGVLWEAASGDRWPSGDSVFTASTNSSVADARAKWDLSKPPSVWQLLHQGSRWHIGCLVCVLSTNLKTLITSSILASQLKTTTKKIHPPFSVWLQFAASEKGKETGSSHAGGCKWLPFLFTCCWDHL